MLKKVYITLLTTLCSLAATTATCETIRCTLPDGQILFSDSECPGTDFLPQKARQEKSLRALTPRWRKSQRQGGKTPVYCRSRSGQYYRC